MGRRGKRLPMKTRRPIHRRARRRPRAIGSAFERVGVGAMGVATKAGRLRGRVLVVDRVERQIVLTDGTELWIDPDVPLDVFLLNRTVHITYDERNGRRWARRVEPVD